MIVKTAILKSLYFIIFIILLQVISSCSITKHVPENKYLLDKVSIEVEDNTTLKIKDLYNYLRQVPNHRVLGKMRLQLMFYNISGTDSTKSFNKWIQKVGAAPIIYDRTLTDISISQLTKAMQNKGYMYATVYVDSLTSKKKKIELKYKINAGLPYYINSISYNIKNDTIRKLVLSDSASFVLKEKSLFDRNNLELERQQIAQSLKNKGYYLFNKDYITYVADTTANYKQVDLTLNLMSPLKNERIKLYTSHRPFYIRNVTFITNFNTIENNNTAYNDTIIYKGLNIIYGKDKYLRPSVLDENCFIKKGELYNASNTNRTYESLGRLGILKFINITYSNIGECDGKLWIDAVVLLTKGKSQNVSLSLEGTNSEGDLGFGVGASYQHRNIGHGSEILNTKFKASYESLSGDLSGLINDNYTEYSANIGLVFPKFKAPFLKNKFKQNIRANTEIASTFSYQKRPEFTRVILGAGWKYHWSDKSNLTRQTFDLIDINYIYLPKTKFDFLENITNPLLRYSYENHFIMRLGYVFYHTNKNNNSVFNKKFQPNIYTLRAGIETAGNVLFGLSNITNQKKENDAYKIFGINYAQYIKGEVDYTITHKFNPKHMIAFHGGCGIGVPYGNSSILPFEKRFYAGGANGVRGWAVRTLGPGKYAGNNSVTSFINQCGDIRLDLNLEYRAKLFWVFELGLFMDAGNIWTIQNYENQQGGNFQFNTFWKETAMAYGLGLRLDFTYFLLRFDLGMKGYNPAEGAQKWPLVHPNWNRDAAFHFSVGYPF